MQHSCNTSTLTLPYFTMKTAALILTFFWSLSGFCQTQVASSFTILDYWTGKLCPPGISHKSLIESGGELHGYQISPSDTRALNGAQLVVGLNPSTEPWLADWAKSNRREADVIWLNPDPSRLHLHAWLNPETAKEMVTQLSRQLSTRFKLKESDSQNLLRELLKEIDGTATSINKLFEPIPLSQRKIITHHPNLESFADYFKISVVATIVDSAVAESADPSVLHYSEILKAIKKERVRVVAYDEGQSSRIAVQLTKDGQLPPPIALSFEYLQPQGKEGDTWPTMMLLNARKIADALQK